MKLKKGDLIDIIAPASVPKNQDWRKGISLLEEWGLRVRFPDDSLKPWIFHSHNNKKRFSFLKKAFQSSSKAVWVLRGGYGSQKLMPSFQKIKIQKKLFIGFSDATVLHLYLNGICKIPSLHAPSICELPYLSKKELSALHKTLFDKEEDYITIKGLKSFNNFKANITGTLIGGNLTLIQTSIGTKWFPSLNSKILFLEDINEEDYRIDRALHQLYFSGALKGVKALIFGYLDPITRSQFENTMESLSDILNIPLFYQIPCGHKSPNMPLPLGTKAEISSKNSDLKIKIF